MAAVILAELCTLTCLITKLGRIHRPGIPEEHMLLDVLRGKKWMEDFSFFPPVSQFIKCDQEGECTELGDEKSVSGRSFGFSCCSPPIAALYELTLQCVCVWGGGEAGLVPAAEQESKNPLCSMAALNTSFLLSSSQPTSTGHWLPLGWRVEALEFDTAWQRHVLASVCAIEGFVSL